MEILGFFPFPNEALEHKIRTEDEALLIYPSSWHNQWFQQVP